MSKRTYADFLGLYQRPPHIQTPHTLSTLSPQKVINNKPVDKIYLVSIDGSDHLTSDEFPKAKRQQQFFTILATTPIFLERTLFVVVICYSNETIVHMFYENFSIEQKFQISFEPKKTFLNNNQSEFKWSSVFSKTSKVISDLRSFIVSSEFQGDLASVCLPKKVTLLVYMFLCGGNNESNCKELKQTIFETHSSKQQHYRWYPKQSTTDHYNHTDVIGSSAVWIFVLPDVVSFNDTLHSLNDQKKLVKSINDEIRYEGIVAVEFPSDEFTLHTLLNQTPTISSSSKGMNTAINNKLMRVKEGSDRNKVLKSARNYRYLLEINKTHNGPIIYRAIRDSWDSFSKIEDFFDSTILTIPDIHSVLIQLQRILSPFLSKIDSCSSLVDFIVAKFNMISVLIDNHGCWNQFLSRPDKVHECKLGRPGKQVTTHFHGNQHQQFNSSVFQFLSTVFVGHPNYENERFIISKILLLVSYQCKLCNRKISDHESFLRHYYLCQSEIQPKTSWPLSSDEENSKLFCELKQKFPELEQKLPSLFAKFIQ